MLQVFRYVGATWIRGTIWPPAAWTCYNQSIRTNNDVEGWHHRLNVKAQKPNLPLYLLIKLLHTEAEFVDIQAMLVSELHLTQEQRKRYQRMQGRLAKYWQQFECKERTAKSLLSACAALQGNARMWK